MAKYILYQKHHEFVVGGQTHIYKWFIHDAQQLWIYCGEEKNKYMHDLSMMAQQYTKYMFLFSLLFINTCSKAFK